MHVFRLESHLQSPAHHVAPCPREHSSQVGARWLPQLTGFVDPENTKKIVRAFELASHNKLISITSYVELESIPASLHLHPGHFL